MDERETYGPAWRRMRNLLLANGVLGLAFLSSIGVAVVFQRVLLFMLCGVSVILFIVANVRLLGVARICGILLREEL